MIFKDKKITIMGLGISNMSIIKYLSTKSIGKLVVTDMKNPSELYNEVKEIKELFPHVSFELGFHTEKSFIDTNIIVKNASIPNTNKYLQKAIKNNIDIETDISLFFKIFNRQNIIGITGTKGKTTTSHIIYESLRNQNLEVVIGGNMGIPVFNLYKKIKRDTLCVLELSSWMVESLEEHQISPHIAIYTNLLPDHLNYYTTYNNYKNSKKGLFLNQKKDDYTFLNIESKDLLNYIPEIRSKYIVYSNKDLPKNIKTNLLGTHYLNNIAAAYALINLLDLDKKVFLKTIEDFRNIEHRMENLGTINDIEFINNTTATNPSAFIADLEALEKKQKPIYLLMGGSDKNLDLEKMVDKINKTNLIKKIVLFKGTATEEIIKDIDNNKVLGIFENMRDAFSKIHNNTEPNSIIMLNPGCASFGVFKNEFDRGNQFKECIKALK